MTKARTNADNASADIQGVTAGTGLSGGGTSGTVTLTNDMATTIAAKGDLVVGTGNDTYAALTAGNAGDTLVADSSATTGLRWQADWNTGKNKIINGDFGIWQRGTTFTAIGGETYYADRFRSNGAGNSYSRQSFTAGTAPVAGYESAFFARGSVTGTGSTQIGHSQLIEDVRTLAGQTATLSFWAKADSARTLSLYLTQEFGSGGSAQVVVNSSQTWSLTTSWTRFTVTVSMPSISGKTIGTNNAVGVTLYLAPGQASGSVQLDTWGWQFEAGSVATPFTTATGTLAGELAACQRYYQKSFDTATAPTNGSNPNGQVYYTRQAGSGNVEPTAWIPLRVTMRTAPSVTLFNSYLASPTGQWSDGSTSSANARTINASDNGFTIDNTDVTYSVTNAAIHYTASAEL